MNCYQLFLFTQSLTFSGRNTLGSSDLKRPRARTFDENYQQPDLVNVRKTKVVCKLHIISSARVSRFPAKPLSRLLEIWILIQVRQIMGSGCVLMAAKLQSCMMYNK